MSRIAQRDALIFVLLVSLGAGLRLVFQDLPNFAPVAALALFAGYFFRSRTLAVAVPLAAMLLSDLFIGSYGWQMMALVYSMLALPALCGGPLRRYCQLNRGGAWRPLVGLLTCSLGASLAFFFVTNFGAWIWFETYSNSWSGLVACYVAALPFFRYTLSGDLLFAVLLFGSYAVSLQLSRHRQVRTVAGLE